MTALVRTTRSKLFMITLWFSTVLYVYYLYNVELESTAVAARLKSENKTKILIYSEILPYIVRKQLKAGFNSKQCSNCILVEGKVTYDTRVFDAIVFMFNRVNLNDPIFQRRRGDQIYVWYSPESTSSVRNFHQTSMNNYEDVFNLTMTYRRDSDVINPYGTLPSIKSSLLEQHDSLSSDALDKVVTNKNGIIWVASNCGVTSGAKMRMKIVEDLKRSQVGWMLDVYGLCGDGKTFTQDRSGFNNMNELIKSYKFYLAFENSYHCRDYITEKFWENSLLNAVVPVVWGPTREDVMTVAPPHSFIHVEDFKNISDLADYLLYLDRNDTAYREYFNWWFEPTEDIEEPVALCKLCLMYESRKRRPSSIKNLKHLFYDRENEECLTNGNNT
uniref:alpha-(1,3)-fucosyltransferase 6-like isoform X2 n=1 Tax=Ciona intestinalis TaxID=7719 RepID=UPI00089DAF54|nr:alpha-(1,3)-fucosyltransferase 6-like isoform X2 [Ciona intestinalis]|eukprot:XP_018672473.1 alpha-(1,3)-fucosyltransferase 6-like isoform X2 [Ciona intestinalis]